MSFLDFSFRSSALKMHRLPESERPRIYFSFDDGPRAGSTEQVLDLFDELALTATFFVITERVRKNRALFERTVKSGHAIGDHSLDHNYWNYLSSRAQVQNWIKASWEELSEMLGRRPVGFRPPAGVVTPPLLASLEELGIPLILWTHRYFDTRKPPTEMVMARSLRQARDGDLLLLHDALLPDQQRQLCQTLRPVLIELRARDLLPSAIASLRGDT